MRLFSKILSILVFIWCVCNGISAFLDFNNPENFMYTKTENTIFLNDYQVKSKHNTTNYKRYCIDGELLRVSDSTTVYLKNVTNIKDNQYHSLEAGIPVFMYVNNENTEHLYLELIFLGLIIINIFAIYLSFKK